MYKLEWKTHTYGRVYKYIWFSTIVRHEFAGNDCPNEYERAKVRVTGEK